MTNNIFNSDFNDFLSSFERAGVEYVLVGGYSVIIHGYQRTTGDMDLFVNPTSENYSKIIHAFDEFGMSLFSMTLERFLNIKEIDVFKKKQKLMQYAMQKGYEMELIIEALKEINL